MTCSMVLDAVVAGASILAAAGTLALAWVGVRNLPPIRRRLTETEFIVGEMHELLQMQARRPDQSMSKDHNLSESTLLVDTRVGRHEPAFDRIVFEFLGELPGYAIAPLDAAELADRELRGDWGLSVRMRDCRVHRRVGPNRGEPVTPNTNGRPGFPALTEHMLFSADDRTVEWSLSCPSESYYLPFELDDPPRLVIDLLRQSLA